MPCSLMSLKSHLLRRHLFCNLRSRMPRPPKSLGVHKTLHLVSLYFFLSPPPRDENGFGIFRNSGNRFRNFSIGFIGNGIFRKRNRFSEFSIGIGIGIGVVFYRPFPSVIGFCRKLPDLCLGIFRYCVSEFFGIVSRNFSEFSSM
jgi:hypothetical protein